MVKVSVEACSGAARFRVSVQAQSIERALSLVAYRHPGSEIRVEFPINPESFFAEDRGARSGMAGRPERAAA